MNLFWIKILALVTMLIDHLGVFIFPNQPLLRLIGRLSFPLFAWGIANGARYTRSINKYLLRIFILAVISQIPYFLIFKISGVSNPEPNILFTFSLALSAIILLNKTKSLLSKLFVIICAALLAFVLKMDYQAFGVISVIVFYMLYDNNLVMGIAYLALTVVFFLVPLYINRFLGGMIGVSYINIFELVSVVSIFIIALYNNKKGKGIKYLFYAFYPLHLLLLYFIKLLIS